MGKGEAVPKRDVVQETQRNFDCEDKPQHWHTAFYYYVEHMRYLTKGETNHKKIYALIGTHGRYINHANPTIRKRTAASLSRIVHTEQYVIDFKESYAHNQEVFSQAAHVMAQSIERAGVLSLEESLSYIRGPFWHDVEKGIANEQTSWRVQTNIARVKNEVYALFSGSKRGVAGLQALTLMSRVELLLSSYLQIMVFGHLSEEQLNYLIQETPALPDCAKPSLSICERPRLLQVCLMRYSQTIKGAISKTWLIGEQGVFTIGRFTDCDAIDPCPVVSRLHGVIFRQEGSWYYRDCVSSHGSRVVRGEEVVLDTVEDQGATCCELLAGDKIILAGASCYWFGGLYDALNPQYAEEIAQA